MSIVVELSPVEAVLRHFGGQTGVARFLGVSQQSVCQWVQRGRVPDKHKTPLAREMGVDVGDLA